MANIILIAFTQSDMVDINDCPFHLREDKDYKSFRARYYISHQQLARVGRSYLPSHTNIHEEMLLSTPQDPVGVKASTEFFAPHESY